MLLVLYVFLVFALAVLGQWGFYVVRDFVRRVFPQQPVRSGMRLLVVYGREVSDFGKIEGRFCMLLDEAAALMRVNDYHLVVVLGGDHHGHGTSYAQAARQYLINKGLSQHQIMTPTDGWINGLWAFSCSQELDVAYSLQQQGALVTMLGESQRNSRYRLLALAKGVDVETILVPSTEPQLLWLIALVLTFLDPNENHLLRGMNLLKRVIVTARDRTAA